MKNVEEKELVVVCLELIIEYQKLLLWWRLGLFDFWLCLGVVYLVYVVETWFIWFVVKT